MFLPGLDTKLTDLSVQGKTGLQVKQQFVTKTLIPRILTNILQMTAWKKILHSNWKVQLYNVPLNWWDTGILVLHFQIKTLQPLALHLHVATRKEPLCKPRVWLLPCLLAPAQQLLSTAYQSTQWHCASATRGPQPCISASCLISFSTSHLKLGRI